MNNGTKRPETAVESDAGPLIRSVRRADLPRIVAMDEHVTGLRKPEYWEDFFERCAKGKVPRFFFVAELNGRVVGFISGEVRAWEFGSPPCGWVFAINVDPEVREASIGSRLFTALTEQFAAAGTRKVRTMLARGDHLLMSFFRSQGMMAGPYIELEKDIAVEVPLEARRRVEGAG